MTRARGLLTAVLISGAAAVTGLVGCGGSRPSSAVGAAAMAGVAAGAEESSGPPIAVVVESTGSAAALALVVPGSGWEPAGATGVTLLAARSVLAEVEPELGDLGARAEVDCGRWAFVITVVAPAESWRRASEAVLSALSAGDPSAASVSRARSGLEPALRLDDANPAWQARLAAGRALYGGDGGETAWSRPSCGVPETLELFDAAAVREAAGRLDVFAAAAVVGAVDSADVGAVSSRIRALRSSGPARLTSPPPAAPGRIYVERNTVTAWLTVGWPFGVEADAEAVGVLGGLLESTVGPAVTRPWVLHAASEVEAHDGGGALIVTVVTAPAEAARTALALEDAVDRVIAGLEPESLLERVGRARWGTRLVALEDPGARAARAALDLVRGGAGSPWPRRTSFTAEAIREAAAVLGIPARAVVGPRAARGAAVP